MPIFVNKPLGGTATRFSSKGRLLAHAAGQAGEDEFTLSVYWRSSRLFSDYMFQLRHLTKGKVVQAVAKVEGSRSKEALGEDINAAVLDGEGEKAIKQVVDRMRESVVLQAASFNPWPPEIHEALTVATGAVTDI
jgi:hypothetical protein